MPAKRHIFVLVSLAVVIYFLVSVLPGVTGSCSNRCPCVSNRAFCNGMHLTRVPADLPGTLRYLDLNDNKLKYIHISIFSKFRHLHHLMMAGNIILYIQPGAFGHMKTLRGLNLSRNKLRNVTKEIFHGLCNIEMISLSYNNLESAEGVFYNLRRLEVVNMKYNAVKRVTQRTFYDNIRMRYLDLSHNQISQLHQDAFRRLRRLKYLILNSNPLKTLEALYFDGRRLQLVDFAKCQLKRVIKGLPRSVHQLRMEGNNVFAISEGDFHNTTRLKVLVLSSNHISYIHPTALKRLRNIKEIWLDGNRVKKLPQHLPSKVRGLFLQNNIINGILDNTFKANHKLEMLYLQKNNIANVTRRTFRGLRNLRNLDLDSNNIQIIAGKSFKQMHNLQTLDLSKNPILHFHRDCFRGLTNLITLKLSNINTPCSVKKNLLRYVRNLRYLDLDSSPNVAKEVIYHDIELGYLNKLTDLNLMHNQLHRLAREFPSRLPELKIIKLSGNPWCCDQLLMWLQQWLSNHTVEFFLRHEIKCAMPKQLQNLPIKEVSSDELNVWDPMAMTDNFPVTEAESKTKPVKVNISKTNRERRTRSKKSKRGRKKRRRRKKHRLNKRAPRY